MNDKHVTRLTKSDLKAIEYEVELLAGEPPTLDDLDAAGYTESRWLVSLLDLIAGTGRVITLLAAEAIQALAALIIAGVFAVLEYWRVVHGAAALGQTADQAALIAFAVVTANVVHPIYALRGLRGQNQLTVTQMTGRGYLGAFWRRLTGQPTTETVDLYHNPTLHLAAAVITWSTIVLAVYDILGPLLTAVFTGNITQPIPLAVMELLMGLGLSVAGVFFLQSAAHEIGVRTLTDQPQRLTAVLEQRQADYLEQVAAVRTDVTARYMAAKLADQERKATSPVNPTQLEEDTQPVTTIPGTNGAGRYPA